MSFIRSNHVKIRKERHCEGCAIKQDKGTIMNCVVFTDGGDIMSSYWCYVCDEYYKRFVDSEDAELIYYGSLKSEDKEGWERLKKELDDEATRKIENLIKKAAQLGH